MPRYGEAHFDTFINLREKILSVFSRFFQVFWHSLYGFMHAFDLQMFIITVNVDLSC